MQDLSPSQYRRLITLATIEIEEHNSEYRYVTGASLLDRLREAAGFPAGQRIPRGRVSASAPAGCSQPNG